VEPIPYTVKLTKLTCPHCGCSHSFSGYLENKNLVICPRCHKLHPLILEQTVEPIMKKVNFD